MIRWKNTRISTYARYALDIPAPCRCPIERQFPWCSRSERRSIVRLPSFQSLTAKITFIRTFPKDTKFRNTIYRFVREDIWIYLSQIHLKVPRMYLKYLGAAYG